jgi:hypothetical protein
VISGFNLFTAQIAKEVSDSTLGWEPHVLRASRKLERLASLGHLLRADVWYTIGSPITDRWLHLVARVLRKPRVVHWVGSDIQTLKRCPDVLQWCRRDDVRHLAEVDWMIEELRTLGLKANLAPLPPRTLPPAAPPPLPERFTVLLYMPRHRGDFYGCREYQRLFRTFSGRPIKFIVVGGGDFYAPEDADVEDLGWCTDLRSVYERTSVLLRFTRHDGLSLMALEALSYGRHVLWTQEFPFTTRVQTYHECEREISSLLERHLAGTLEPQLEMAQYIRETYDSKRCVERIANVWEEAAQKRPLPLKAIEAQP